MISNNIEHLLTDSLGHSTILCLKKLKFKYKYIISPIPFLPTSLAMHQPVVLSKIHGRYFFVTHIPICVCLQAYACVCVHLNIPPVPKEWGPYQKRDWEDFKSQRNRKYAVRFHLLEVPEMLCPQSLINMAA